MINYKRKLRKWSKKIKMKPTIQSIITQIQTNRIMQLPI